MYTKKAKLLDFQTEEVRYFLEQQLPKIFEPNLQ